MSSNAISFQGSTLEIGTGSGGALTVTAISKALKAEVTANNTLKVGDRVTFASVVGMTQINGLVGSVVAASATTFCVDIDSRAFTTYTSGGTATPVTWTEINDIKSVQFSPGGRSEIDVTNLKSVAKEKRYGLKDNGTMNGDVNIDLIDAGQSACRASEGSDDVKDFRMTLPGGAGVATFQGQVKKMSWGGAVDASFSGSYEIGITGEITWA